MAFHIFTNTHGISPFLHSMFSLGRLAVQVFFCASGFLIMRSFEKRYEVEENPNGNFFLRRALRILPLWWTLLLFLYVFRNMSFDVLWKNMSFAFGFLSFQGKYLPIVPAWSLFVEECFYLFFPLFFKSRKKVDAWVYFILFYLISFVWNRLAPEYGIPTTNGFVDRFPLSQFHFFFLGMMIYQIYERKDFMDKIQQANNIGFVTWLDAFTVLAVISLMAKMYVPTEFVVSLIILSALIPGTLLNRMLDMKFIRWIGVRCYGIYILHTVLFAELRYINYLLYNSPNRLSLSTDQATWIYFFITVGVTSAIAALSFLFIEKPCIALGEKLIKRISTKKNVIEENFVTSEVA